MDFTITTRGLPKGAAGADPERPYSFEISWQYRLPGWVLSIPRYQCGQSEFSADFPEQERWLTALCARKPWLEEVWFVTWQLPDWRRLARILEPLRISGLPERGLADALTLARGEEARRRSLQLCRQFPDDPYVHQRRAETLVAEERWRAAQHAIRRLLNRWPDLAANHALQSDLHVRRGRVHRAVEAGWRAVELDRERIPGFCHLLVQRQRLVPAAESLAAWERLEALCVAAGRPAEAYARANMASCRWSLGDIPGARGDLDVSLQLDPEGSWAHRLRARLRAQVLDDPQGARRDFEAILARDPKDAEALAFLAG